MNIRKLTFVLIFLFLFYALFKLIQLGIAKAYLLNEGQQWRYTEQYPQNPPESEGAIWKELAFPDEEWKKGKTPIGYDFSNLEAKALLKTVLSYRDGRPTYLRKKFYVPFLPVYMFSPLTLRVASDNGAIVYLNGVIIDADFDPDMPAGHEYRYWNRVVEVNPRLLKSGHNIVAVYLHNNEGSSDCFFELTIETYWASLWRKWVIFLDIGVGLFFIVGIILIAKHAFVTKRLRTYIAQQNDDEVISLIKRLKLKKSSDPDLLAILAAYYEKKRNKDNFVEVALQLTKVQRNSAESLEILAQAYKKAEKYDKAIEILKQIIERADANEIVENNAKKMLGEVYISIGELDKAETILNQVVKEIPLGEAFIQKGLIKRRDLTLALRERKKTGASLAETLLKKGLVTKEDLDELSQRKTDSDVMEKLAEIKTMKKDKEGATNIYKTMLSIKPDDYTAIFKISKMRYQENEIEQAIPGFQKVSLSESKYKEPAYYYLTLCFLKKAQTNIALKYLNMLNLNTLSKDELYNLAELLEDNKRDKEAFNLYSTILQRDLKFKDVAQKVEKLDTRLSESEGTSFDNLSENIKGFAEKTKNRYTDFELIGQGGMGMIYKALDKKLNRTVAIKMISRALQEDSKHLNRFLREAQAIAMLNHRNIIGIYDIVTEKIPFMVMEYFDGWNLTKEISKKGEIDYKRVHKIVRQFADAMAYAHKQGIIHRDIKPENIMTDAEGLIKITDFGLAKCLSLTALTDSGFYGGTQAYMAPEQKKTGVTDKYSDIYSFGIVFLELLTGRITRPEILRETNLQEFIEQNPRMKNDDFRKIILKCVETDPKRRFQSFDEIIVELDKIEIPT